MAGLPTKNNQFEEQFIYPNGAPKEGTKGYYYLQELIKQVGDKAYLEGIKFTINDIVKRLKPLVYMQFEENEEIYPLPEYAKELNDLITCLTEYCQGLKTQINNLNKTNFREGTRALILRAERIMGEKKGDIINPLLKVNVSPIKEERGAKPGEKRGAGRKRVKPIVEQKIKEEIDPADLLKNEEVKTDDTQENKE